MGLIGESALCLDHLPHIVRIVNAINFAVLFIDAFEGLVGFAILLPIHRMRKHQPPVAAQINVRLFRGDLKEMTI
jgi:hypothetical protein